MKRITLKDKRFKPFISTPHIENATRDIAAALNEKFKHETEPVVFLTVLNGAVPFAASLLTKLKFPVVFDTVKISSYDGMTRNSINFEKSPSLDLLHKKVIIVEDIIDTGQTIDYLKMYLETRGCIEVTIAALLFKIEIYKEHHPDFSHWSFLSGKYNNDMMIGMTIGNNFVVGYGLDYDGLGRNLNKIYVLDE